MNDVAAKSSGPSQDQSTRFTSGSATNAPIDELGHFAMFDYPDGCSRPRWLSASSDGLALAVQFHEIYERLAPSFGYETRPDTKAFDPESKNGKLMAAVCKEILVRLGAK